MFPAKSEEILISVSSAEPHIFWRAEKIRNLEFELPPFALALLSLFFLARLTKIEPLQLYCIIIDYAIFFTHPPLPDVLAYARTSGT